MKGGTSILSQAHEKMRQISCLSNFVTQLRVEVKANA
jgi:hypothetical protein